MSTAKKKPHARGSERGAKTKATKKFMATIKSGLSKGKLQLRTAPAVSNGEAAAIKAAADDAKQAMPVLGGEPGIGKDTMLQALKQSVGPWNFKEVSPQAA